MLVARRSRGFGVDALSVVEKVSEDRCVWVQEVSVRKDHQSFHDSRDYGGVRAAKRTDRLYNTRTRRADDCASVSC